MLQNSFETKGFVVDAVVLVTAWVNRYALCFFVDFDIYMESANKLAVFLISIVILITSLIRLNNIINKNKRKD